jgi:hypothetical protein
MATRTEGLEVLLDAGVLLEGLDEGADGVLHHRSHLVFQLRELRRRKTLVEPRMVCFEIKIRIANQEVRLAVAGVGREPGIGMLQVLCETFDVG